MSPKPLWSEKSKFRKSWNYFSSNAEKIVPKPKPKKSTSQLRKDDVEFDEYFQLFASRYNLLGSRSKSEESLNNFYGSNQSIFTGSFRSSAVLSQIECESCKNVIRRNRRCSMCSDCIEKLYSPKICVSCKGRISFFDLKHYNSSSIDKGSTTSINRTSATSTLKLCNCFPKDSSQLMSSIQPDSIQTHPDIKGKSYSDNELVTSSRQLTWSRQRTSPAFFSQPMRETTDDEKMY